MNPYVPELASSVERLDEAAIRALADRYSDAVNQRDWQSYRVCWADEAIWELGPPIDQRQVGIEAIMAEVQRAVGAMDLFVQMPHAFTLLALDTNTAVARVTLNEIGRIRPDRGGVEGINILAVYTDTLTRGADGRWRYASRSYKVLNFDGRAPEGQIVSHI